MSELDDWVAAAAAELGLKSGDVQPKVVLDVAREVAHQVLRPAAPLTAYLMGVAVGRGTDPADTAARISALALAWPDREASERGREAPERGREDPERGREDPETVADPPTQ
jgi:hypothetical protein